MAPFDVLNCIARTAVQQTVERTVLWETGSKELPDLTPSSEAVEVGPPSVIPLKL